MSEPTRPRIFETIELEINLPEHQDTAMASAAGGPLFAYDTHYCAANRAADPTALARSWTSSGIRAFDVRDPAAVREIAYYGDPDGYELDPVQPTRGRLYRVQL
ncbi:hypothetical protein [Nocardia implantans]|uniref:Uncharacterized protein n=1 Tax=Nocardia implantans TaxID=3108168 RepID=A0ABU6B3T7_9NOCA|nr:MULTISPECIES: hypothetical protein [unclassified Nocardia]MBF6196094.1 hypothetical protein [Nocardia beijingensis]MEA3532529.1 hypothetical protein [Nocardia sp. CDC192]MEB3514438.1 hypothetical protein [Nocardia sp. CDC186]